MQMSPFRQPRLRALGVTVVALAFGVIGCLAFTGVSYASAPHGGINCASDGGIDGFGSTLQRKMLSNVFIAGFTSDVCGTAAIAVQSSPYNNTSPSTTDDMVAYDWQVGTNGATGATGPNGATLNTNDEGSGAGIEGAECRAGDFWGTDIPYNYAQLTDELDAPPGAPTDAGTNGFPGCDNTTSVTGTFDEDFEGLALPFAPTGGGAGINPSVFPNADDTTANVMTIPLGASAVTLMVNLEKKDCGGSGTSQFLSKLQLNTQQISWLMGGDVLNWSSPLLQGAAVGLTESSNTTLSSCNVPVTRVVRLDDSGSTNAFKEYMALGNGNDVNRTSANVTCHAGAADGDDGANIGPAWNDPTSHNGSAILPTVGGVANNLWPGQTTGGVSNAALSGCSAVDVPSAAGGGALVNVVDGAATGGLGALANDGEVGYADLADESGKPVTLVNEYNPAAASPFQSPNAGGTTSNCDLSSVTLPGSGPQGAVGLQADGWATDNASNGGAENYSLQTFAAPGVDYPDCALTYDLVYSGTSSDNGAGQGPVSQMNIDQRQTEYSFFTYILSSTGQRNLNADLYQQLPPGTLPTLQSGFQTYF